MAQHKFLLDEKDLPTHWYNIQADLPFSLPPVIHPGTKQPIGPQDLAPLFAMELIRQEVSRERWIEIPEEVREVYKLWRPSPLYRAVRLELCGIELPLSPGQALGEEHEPPRHRR